MRPARRVERTLEKLERMPCVEDHFDLEDELGHGGMGIVYRGTDRHLGRAVALKVLGEGHRNNAVFARRFLTEAQLGAQLEHPNIVPLYGLVATAKGHPAFVMKLVEGETMARYLQACGASVEASRTPPHDLLSRLERFLKVCDAVQYAHARGVIHRDLKPDNVMLGVHNEVYVMDWGVARLAENVPDGPADDASATPEIAPSTGSDASLTQSGDVFGTPGYMSPEQARAEPVSFATDQYALGAMLAEIVTLNPPRAGATIKQISEAVLELPIEIEPRFDPVPRELLAIIRKATSSRVSDRYESVDAFSADVRRFTRDESVHALPDPSWLRVWRRMKRRPVFVLGALLALVVVVTATTVTGLVRELGAHDRAASQSARMASLTASVGAAGRSLDTRFQRIELLVEGLAQSAAEILKRPPGKSVPPVTPASLAPPESPAARVDRYEQRVTFDSAVHVRSPNVSDADVRPILERFGDLEDALAKASARSAGDDEVLALSTEMQHAAAKEKARILWSDLAFEAGEVLVYPGNTFFPPDYDVRSRTWYVAARERHGHVWGAPYPDATSGKLIVPCSRSFQDDAGKLEGVAAAHVRLDDVLDLLSVRVDGFQWAALVDDQGDVVLSTKDRGVQLGAGINGNRDGRNNQREPFPFAQVRQAIVGRARDGLFHEDATLVVAQRLDTNGWTFAVVVDAAPYAF